MIAIMVLIFLIILGLICWFLDTDPNKLTLDDFVETLYGYKGITALVFILLTMFITMFCILIYPSIIIVRWVEK